ncbi:MAG: nicotinamidase [Spirochaetaceae bacterium]|jgi:nicotinamidase/pyrazinamidase|nr:nicotinamidase [Spirochaetaceae bacterium]
MPIVFSKSALLEIDVQNDFCLHGALAITDGDGVIPPLNDTARSFAEHGAPVIATQDWHPAKHCSFVSSGGTWPPHCVQGSQGAELHPALDKNPLSLILRKGFRPDMDSYSAFFENDRKTPTGLAGYLKSLGRETVYIGGLATDYCVLYSALDAVALGFRTLVFADSVRGVNIPEGSVVKAFVSMKAAGITII